MGECVELDSCRKKGGMGVFNPENTESGNACQLDLRMPVFILNLGDIIF